ncbi:MAG: YfiR family protein [Acidobacteriaceae bacterium]
MQGYRSGYWRAVVFRQTMRRGAFGFRSLSRPVAWSKRLCPRREALTRVTLVLALLLSAPPFLDAQHIKATEAQLKAAFLFNFAKYVTWPHSPESHFNICILGPDPFGPALDSIVTGETLAGKPAQVRRIRGTHEASGCQIVFVSSSDESRLQSILDELATTPALTVSDMPGFVDRGGMIQFVTEGDRVRFIVNLAAAQKVGLVLSSELLKVAKAVQLGRGPGAA